MVNLKGFLIQARSGRIAQIACLAALALTAWSVPALAAPPTDLDARLSSSSTSLVDSSGVSCQGDVINPLRLAYDRLQLRWKKKFALKDVSIILAFQHPAFEGGRLICELSPGEVDAMLGIADQTLPAQSTVTSVCMIQCGDVKLVEPSLSFKADGAMTIAGRYQDTTSGGRFAVQTVVPVSLVHVP